MFRTAERWSSSTSGTLPGQGDPVGGGRRGGRAARERERGQRLAYLTSGDDDAPVEAVGDLADDHRQDHQRHELHQPDQAEVERIVGELVDLPADRHPLHHVGAVGEGARAPKQHERAVARQRGSGGLGHGVRARAEWRAVCRSGGCRGSRSSRQSGLGRRRARRGRGSGRWRTTWFRRCA